jgi:hypothetical protein
MAMIPCPECKREISTAARSCPSCGYSLQGKPAEPQFEVYRKRSLTGALIDCIIGLPIGVVLWLPVVRGLAIAGIIIAGLKLASLREAP